MPHPRLFRYARTQLTALNSNARHSLAASHALVHYDSGAVYSFIPKNGCSTLRLTLGLANACLASEEDFAWIHTNNDTFRASLRELITAPYTFAILRCPFRRLASAYLDKIASRTAVFWALHRATGDQLDPDMVSFREFVETIGKPKLFRLNIHWRPQLDFLVYEQYDDLFRMERFNEIAPTLRDRAGLELVDARNYTRHGTSGLQHADSAEHADTPAHMLLDMRRNGVIPRYDAFYDEPLIARVAKLYREDLAFYRETFGADELLFDA